MIEALALIALAAALVAAVARRSWLPEAVAALAGAGLLVAVGGLEAGGAADEARAVGPTLALLAGLLVIGDGCERAALFKALAARIAAASGGSPPRARGSSRAPRCTPARTWRTRPRCCSRCRT